MEWVERLPCYFRPAKLRRHYRHGKRADRLALFRYVYRQCLNAVWGDAMSDGPDWADSGVVLTETTGPKPPDRPWEEK
jgi:hypothetical protein